MRLVTVVALLGAAAFLISQPGPPKQQVGPLPDGSFLLNTFWRVKPVGRQVPLDTLPMSSALSKDGVYLLVLNGGYRPPSISVFRANGMEPVGSTPVPDAWLGLTFSPNGKQVYVGGGGKGSVYEFNFLNGKLEAARTFAIPNEAPLPLHRNFIGDVAVSPDGRLLYVAALFHDAIHVVNLQSGRVIEKWPTGRRPYRILFHPDGKSYLVSSWADGSIYHHNADTGERLSVTRLGQHPTDMVWRARKAEEKDEEQARWQYRLFVAAANTNSVYSVGVSESKEFQVLEAINVSTSPRQPLGMTPTALGFNADQSRLYVACSDANAIAVVDLTEGRSSVAGFIPTGWYPTAVRTLPDGKLLVLNGKGLRSYANPEGPSPVRRTAPSHIGEPTVVAQYVGRMQTGTASVIDPFDDAKLDQYSAEVQRNSPYRDELLDRVETGEGNPIPSRPGDPSPIQHVIYIMKENRTYDQVLGDLGKGNGDKSLTLFDENIGPNHHKLAREFVLFDNFYVNADVSADGHNWSTSAIAPDYVQKMWPNSYAGRRKFYDYEGGEVAALPGSGRIWNNAASAGITMRNYGFWVTNAPLAPQGSVQISEIKDAALNKITNRNYRGFDLEYADTERARTFIAELQEMEKSGTALPKITFLRLGNDHTAGSAAGKLTPQAMFADNDYALGLIVEAVSKSRYWANTAIFVLEDDAQNGPDHVDSHRSPAYVLSPYTRRGVIDSTMYNTTSMLRTIELIVGLRPMTHFDAAARPMSVAFSNKPDIKPYVAEQPRIPLDTRNPGKSAGAAASAKLDFSEADRADDDALNDILWRAIRKTEPPVPVRSFFAR